MNKISCCLLSFVVAFSLALPHLAVADKSTHGYYKHGYKQKHGHKKFHQRGNRHLRDYRYPDQRVTHYYKPHNSHEKLLIGLLVGGIAGYAISNAQKNRTYGHAPSYPPAQPVAAYPSNIQQPGHSTCLQQREYQTTVVVGGRNVPAYGTACLQPDGSWRHGAAQTASY